MKPHPYDIATERLKYCLTDLIEKSQADEVQLSEGCSRGPDS